MSYIDAYHDRFNDKIVVVEKEDNTVFVRKYPVNHTFYYPDPKGTYLSTTGIPLRKFSSSNKKKFMKEKNYYISRGIKLFESDVNPVFRCLENNYLDSYTPRLNIGYFDIEVDFDPDNGWAKPDNPFSPITAISIVDSSEKISTFVLKPNVSIHEDYYLTDEQALDLLSSFDNVFLCSDERELINGFLDSIENIDVLTGWNSKAFDIPYIVNRMELLFGNDETKRLCRCNQFPRKKKFINYGKEMDTYELVGRIHIDYLDLYRKHNTQQLHSYSLDNVAKHELNESKTPYQGSLDMLYKRDFKTFVEYNRTDANIILKLDKKTKFIELANQLAHANTVLIPTTMGSVALIEQAIINEAHSRNMYVPDRESTIQEEFYDDYDDVVDFDEHNDDDDNDIDNVSDNAAVGAYVADPRKGLHSFIGCCDINSLYPSTIRALNMAPETLVGQIRTTLTDKLIKDRIRSGTKKADAWHNIFSVLEFDEIHNRTDTILTVDFVNGDKHDISAKDLYDIIFSEDSNLIISANGTLFRKDVVGVIPGILSKWYSERKQMQAKEKEFGDLEKHEEDLVKKKEYKKQKEFWNQRQQIRKILLNSLYGALLNESCRFYDKRIGQSTTLTGRSISKHMNAEINNRITGKYDHTGDAIIYADTDSSYFSMECLIDAEPSMKEIFNNRDDVIKMYDTIGEEVNKTFPSFMNTNFNTGIENGAIIKAGRELVASRGLFIKKKKYAVLIFDKEGFRYDVDGKPGKIKAMGLDLKRADTPKYMQDFLESILIDILTDIPKNEIMKKIKQFRKEFKLKDGWEKGSPKRANNITQYLSKIDYDGSSFGKGKKSKTKKDTIPGHVMGSINWNIMRTMNDDRYSMEIQDGQKVVVCKLLPNIHNMKSIAYPIDQTILPDWFKKLRFDNDDMENIIIDKKLNNLLGVLGWNLNLTKDNTLFNDLIDLDQDLS